MLDLLTAFGLVALAELGDKTQLLALAFATRHRAWQVLTGIAVAAALLLGAATLVGGALGQVASGPWVSLGAGVLFLGFAVWTWRDDDEDEDGRGASGEQVDGEGRGDGDAVGGPVRADGGPVAAPRRLAHRTARSALVTVTVAFVIAELGDKTMFAAATLAATNAPLPTWLGATAGMTTSAGLAIVVGRLLHRRLPADRLRLAAAVAFAAFGVLLLVDAARAW